MLAVVLHFGSVGDTRDCVSALLAAGVDCCVVDNDGRNGLSSDFPRHPRLKIVRPRFPLGFSEANNWGAAQSRLPRHDFLLVVNNDVTIPADLVQNLKSALEANSARGAVGCRLDYMEVPGRPWASGGRVNFWTLGLRGRIPTGRRDFTSVDYIPGALILIRLECWDQVVGFSTNYFLAYEEAQFAFEARKKGWLIGVCDHVVAWHRVGMSSDRAPKYFYNKVRNRMTFGWYLLGPVGVAHAIIVNFIFSMSRISRLKVFFLGSWHSLMRKNIDADMLSKVEERFGVEWI